MSASDAPSLNILSPAPSPPVPSPSLHAANTPSAITRQQMSANSAKTFFLISSPSLVFIFGVFSVWKEVRRISYSACLYRQKYTPKNRAMYKLLLSFSIYHLEILAYPYGSCILNTSYNIFYVLFLPLTWEYCTPSFPSGLTFPKQKKCLPPSCRFPPKSFPLKREPTISGDTFGARARATSLRHLCGAANYATCNAPASRRDGALPAYGTSCPRHSLRRRRTCKRGIRPCASFGWAAPTPKKCSSGIGTHRTSERRTQIRSK